MSTTKTVKKAAKSEVSVDLYEEPQNLNEKVEQLLGSKGYKNIEIEQSVNSVYIQAEGKKSGDLFQFEIEFKEEVSHFCCGSIELGEIVVENNIKHLSEELIEELIERLLREKFNEAHKNAAYYGVRMLYFTVPINGNQNKKTYEMYQLFTNGAIKAGFVKVATFTNSNSSNDLEHYIKYE